MRVVSRSRFFMLVLCAALLAISLAAPHQTAHAAGIFVDSPFDNTDAGDGECTLREAITNAEADADTTSGDCAAGSGADTITFDFGIDVTLEGSQLPIINSDITIIGTESFGVFTGIYAASTPNTAGHRVFEQEDGVLTLQDLEIYNGQCAGACNFIANHGGGILSNDGDLNLIRVYMANNSANGNGGAVVAGGNGIYTITDSTFENNFAVSGGGALIGFGGLIQNSTFTGNDATAAGSAIVITAGTIVNTTISGNFGDVPALAASFNPVTVINTTITDNAGGGIFIAVGGTLNISNSIVANQASGSDCSGIAPTSGGNNIESGTSCGFTGSGDQQNTDPLLGPLLFNGGYTQTHLPDPTSPAVDNGNNTICAAAPVNNLDQRGLLRDTTPTCDVGAVERQPIDLIAFKENSTFNGTAYVDVPFDWYIQLTNIGDDEVVIPAGTVLFVDHIPLTLTDISAGVFTLFAADGSVTCTVTADVDWNEVLCTVDGGGLTIYGGGYAEVTITATPTVTGTLDNPVQQDGAFCWVDPDQDITELEEENNFCSDSVTVELAPDLVAVKTNDTGGITTPGATFNWIISIRNQGEGTAVFDDEGCGCVIIFEDILPQAGATFGTPTISNASGLGGTGTLTCDANSVILFCEADGSFTIDPDGGFDITLPVTVTATSGQLTNPFAQGYCFVDPFGITGDIDYDNNACTDTVGINAPAQPPAPTIFDPALSKSGSPASARVGEQVTWTLVVSNPHTVVLPGIVVTDMIPAQFSINSVTTQQGTTSTSGQVITVNVGVLAPGQSVTITIVTTAISSPTNGTICNTAQSGGANAQTCMQVFPSTLPPTGGSSPLMVTLRNSLFALIAVVSIVAAGVFMLKRRPLA